MSATVLTSALEDAERAKFVLHHAGWKRAFEKAGAKCAEHGNLRLVDGVLKEAGPLTLLQFVEDRREQIDKTREILAKKLEKLAKDHSDVNALGDYTVFDVDNERVNRLLLAKDVAEPAGTSVDVVVPEPVKKTSQFFVDGVLVAESEEIVLSKEIRIPIEVGVVDTPRGKIRYVWDPNLAGLRTVDKKEGDP